MHMAFAEQSGFNNSVACASVLDYASALALLLHRAAGESGGAPPQSKTSRNKASGYSFD